MEASAQSTILACVRVCACKVGACVCVCVCVWRLLQLIFPRSPGCKAHSVNHLSSSVLCNCVSSSSSSSNLSFYHPPLAPPRARHLSQASTGPLSHFLSLSLLYSRQTPNTLLSFPLPLTFSSPDTVLRVKKKERGEVR